MKLYSIASVILVCCCLFSCVAVRVIGNNLCRISEQPAALDFGLEEVEIIGRFKVFGQQSHIIDYSADKTFTIDAGDDGVVFVEAVNMATLFFFVIYAVFIATILHMAFHGGFVPAGLLEITVDQLWFEDAIAFCHFCLNKVGVIDFCTYISRVFLCCRWNGATGRDIGVRDIFEVKLIFVFYRGCEACATYVFCYFTIVDCGIFDLKAGMTA